MAWAYSQSMTGLFALSFTDSFLHQSGLTYMGQMTSVAVVLAPPDSYCTKREGSRSRNQVDIPVCAFPKPLSLPRDQPITQAKFLSLSYMRVTLLPTKKVSTFQKVALVRQLENHNIGIPNAAVHSGRLAK